VGFFIITHHGVPPSIIQNAWAAATEFFDLPTEEKEKSVKMEGSQYPYGKNEGRKQGGREIGREGYFII